MNGNILAPLLNYIQIYDAIVRYTTFVKALTYFYDTVYNGLFTQNKLQKFRDTNEQA